MKDIKLYGYFYKSTIPINWLVSLFFSILLYVFSRTSILYRFSIFSMTLGFLISLLIKESSFINKDEYYFYYNMGITKTKLIIFCSIVNIILASILMIGYFYGKQYITN